MRTYLIIFLAVITFFSCKTSQMSLSVVEPAPISIPPNIKEVGIVNRSMPTDENASVNKVDQVLSLEGMKLDKDGSAACMGSLAEELKMNERFEEVKMLDQVDLRNPLLGKMAAPVDWNTISTICEDNQVDALIMLELFDTNGDIHYDSHSKTIEGPLGVKIPALEHEATMTTTISTGWRIYDNVNKQILDESWKGDEIVSTGRGINPVAAASAIIDRKQAVIDVSQNVGKSYAWNMMPYRIRVSRDYFVKGTDNFKVAQRRAQTGNWDGAAELWEKETHNSNSKVAGMACYNMAIISEINGDLEQAVEWAQRSYADYNIKEGLQYVRILKNRIAKREQLEFENQ